MYRIAEIRLVRIGRVGFGTGRQMGDAQTFAVYVQPSVQATLVCEALRERRNGGVSSSPTLIAPPNSYSADSHPTSLFGEGG